VPAKEKALRSIERKQSIKESLYLVLLQKREEAAINLASTTPSVKFLDDATSLIDPISPNRKMLYTIAVLLGLGIPIGILFMVFKLDTKVRNSDDVTSASPRIPLIAEIPRVAEQKKQVTKHDNSPLAEAFRMLRTNINFMLPLDLKGQAPVIMVTSTIKGEGKTFCSMNLSFVYATTNKKVLLIGSDLRNPQLHKYLNEVKSLGGLSDYLHDPTFNWKEHVLEKVLDTTHLDILLSGSVPPNPAELLTNGRFELLLNEARELYDYVIVDTAPSLLVTDTMLIAHLADLMVYVTSVRITEKRLINFSKELKDQGKFNNVAYVLNNVVQPSFSYKYGYKYGYSYNYGYGYGYGQDKDQVAKKPWWRFWAK
jgi:capsular exopolysaccharide synthesis family protein